VDAGLRSQQVALNQAAAGAGEGSASEQITLDAAQTAQKESADAAIKSEGQSMAFREGATAQRKQAALSQAESQRAEDTRRRQQAMKYSMDLVNTAGSAVAELL
jgi:F0F1-type ATP synthase assembly protein I